MLSICLQLLLVVQLKLFIETKYGVDNDNTLTLAGISSQHRLVFVDGLHNTQLNFTELSIHYFWWVTAQYWSAACFILHWGLSLGWWWWLLLLCFLLHYSFGDVVCLRFLKGTVDELLFPFLLTRLLWLIACHEPTIQANPTLNEIQNIFLWNPHFLTWTSRHLLHLGIVVLQQPFHWWFAGSWSKEWLWSTTLQV